MSENERSERDDEAIEDLAVTDEAAGDVRGGEGSTTTTTTTTSTSRFDPYKNFKFRV